MQRLIIGLYLFLGMHLLHLLAPRWRERQLARLGQKRWKALFGLSALAAFALLCWGFSRARAQPLALYVPPLAARPLSGVLTLIAFVLVAAAYVPRNHLKRALGQPMLLGTAAWASAHLLATGQLYDVVLFGSFLLWAVLMALALRQRDRLQDVRYPAGTLRGDALTLALGVVAWAVFACWLHRWLIGVSPLAGMH